MRRQFGEFELKSIHDKENYICWLKNQIRYTEVKILKLGYDWLDEYHMWLKRQLRMLKRGLHYKKEVY